MFGLGNCPGSVYEPDVAEGLWKVAQELSADGINLFGEQADVVDERSGPLEDGAGPIRLSSFRESLSKPKCTQKERALLALEPIFGLVAVDESAFVGQSFFGRADRGEHPGIVGGQESDETTA